MRIVHAVVTTAFAGTERYVADVASEQARQGHEVTVIGGKPLREALADVVQWRDGSSIAAALRSAAGLERVDVGHGHLTYGEFVLAATPRRGKRLVATRHLATPRGQSLAGRVLRPVIEKRLSDEIAISRFVSNAVSKGRIGVLHNGVARCERARPEESKTVLVAQRLEPEKSTEVALHAWFSSKLHQEDWRLVIAGEGSRRDSLEELSKTHAAGSSVSFVGRIKDMDAAYAQAAVVLAPARAEPLGLTVLEAMARGVPVVAAAGGGHRETLADSPHLLFPTDDHVSCAAALDRLIEPDVRRETGLALQEVQRQRFDLTVHVAALMRTYERLLR